MRRKALTSPETAPGVSPRFSRNRARQVQPGTCCCAARIAAVRRTVSKAGAMGIATRWADRSGATAAEHGSGAVSRGAYSAGVLDTAARALASAISAAARSLPAMRRPSSRAPSRVKAKAKGTM